MQKLILAISLVCMFFSHADGQIGVALASATVIDSVTAGYPHDSLASIEKEKDAIRKVISNETEAYYRQDFNGWKSNFVNADYFRMHGYWEGYPERVRYYNGFDTLQRVKHLQFEENRTYWKGSYEKRYNENFRIYPEMAWYTFEQESFDGKTHRFLGKSVEVRIMEKHNGQWKIAYLGFQYLPLPGK